MISKMKTSSSNKIDSRFVYSDNPKWRQGQKQFLWGSEFVSLPPTSKSATSYEFELPTGSTLLLAVKLAFTSKALLNLRKQMQQILHLPWFQNLMQLRWLLFQIGLSTCSKNHKFITATCHSTPMMCQGIQMHF